MSSSAIDRLKANARKGIARSEKRLAGAKANAAKCRHQEPVRKAEAELLEWRQAYSRLDAGATFAPLSAILPAAGTATASAPAAREWKGPKCKDCGANAKWGEEYCIDHKKARVGQKPKLGMQPSYMPCPGIGKGRCGNSKPAEARVCERCAQLEERARKAS